MTDSARTLQLSYAECRRVTRRAHSNFTPCFHLLSRNRRRAMEALYAFMRHTDDLVDGQADQQTASRALGQWREQTAAALAGDFSECPAVRHVLTAVADTVKQFEIPHDYLLAAIGAAEMDLSKKRYATFDELSEYCYRAATVVGLACLRIWGYRGDDPTSAAHACGQAFQLTNILRDLREDLDRGRVYLPQEDMQRFEYSEEDLAAATAGRQFLQLMRFQIQRAEQYYCEATDLAGGLTTEGRRIFVMMIRVYYRLLRKIEADPARVLSERVCLGRWRPLGIMARTVLCPCGKAVLP